VPRLPADFRGSGEIHHGLFWAGEHDRTVFRLGNPAMPMLHLVMEVASNVLGKEKEDRATLLNEMAIFAKLYI